MENWAKLLTSAAAIIGSLAWPGSLLLVILLFRAELRSILVKIPVLIDRMRKASLPGIAFELDQLAKDEAERGADASGQITQRQLQAAARIELEARETGSQAVLNELDRLCLEYDAVRRALPASQQRTDSMIRILVKMRSLAPSAVEFIEIYKGSGSAGSRLAAIAMMQMVPQVADLDWLLARFKSDHPFIFYHAALALQNVANIRTSDDEIRHLRMVAEQALISVEAFSGVPDKNTAEVLNSLISSLANGV